MAVPVDWGIGHYETTAEHLLPAARQVVEAAALRRGERALDVGCGTGNAALLAAERGASVAGIDPAHRLLEVARRRVADAGLDVEFHLADAAHLPFGDGSFGAVLSVFALIFAPDPAAAMTELARVLTPDGRILVSAWLPGGGVGRMNQLAAEIVESVMPTPAADRPFAWYDESAVSELAATAGLSVARTEHALSYSAASPERFVNDFADGNPFAITTERLLAERGVDIAEFRRRLAEALQEDNEDPAGFRSSSRYAIYTFRKTSGAAAASRS